MTDNITIKSGIDINSEEFKSYYDSLKDTEKTFYFLDLAVSNDSPVLSDPLVFDEKEYKEYKIDDIAFILSDGNIIGHMIYTLEKKRPTIPLGLGNNNHLDLERVSELSGRISYSRIEYFCKYNIDINNLIVKYLSNRIRGSLEYKGFVPIESKVHIKK